MAIQAGCPLEQLWLRHQGYRDAEKIRLQLDEHVQRHDRQQQRYTVMRNLNGGTMRGYINKDGTGLLQDQNGNFHNVNTRW